jgi:hypothetical protein
MKITKVDLPAENGFLDRMARYLYSNGGPGRESSSDHILRASIAWVPASRGHPDAANIAQRSLRRLASEAILPSRRTPRRLAEGKPLSHCCASTNIMGCFGKEYRI